MMTELLPISPGDSVLRDLIAGNVHCRQVYEMQMKLYDNIGYHEPWIGYFIRRGDQIIGTCSFKGKPVDGKVEIAYFTFPEFEHQGIATMACKTLTRMAIRCDSSVRVTARTLPEDNYSTKVLKKNGFTCIGTIADPEDGELWEWHYLTGRDHPEQSITQK